MALTLQQLVNLSLRDLNWLRPGQTPSSDESTDAFNTVQEIMGSWSNEGLLVPTHAVTQFALTSGTSLYTMGVGATWVTTGLPIKIKGAISSLTGFQQGMRIMSMGDFNASISNATARTDALPSRLGYDDAAPMRNVALWPTPNSSSAVVSVAYWMPLAAFVALTDVLAFALPGFEQALRDELSLRLAPTYQLPVTPALIDKAQASKLALTRLGPSELPDQEARPQPVAESQRAA